MTIVKQLATKCADNSSGTQHASCEELFLGFFHYYLNVFNYKTHVVSIHRDGPVALKVSNIYNTTAYSLQYSVLYFTTTLCVWGV
jgi:DNA polymerase sigma